MMTTLETLKARINLKDADTEHDAALVAILAAVSAQFDRVCHRKFARVAGATFEFSGEETELRPPCYPIETVSQFELRTAPPPAAFEVVTVEDYALRAGCVISLPAPLGSWRHTGRVTYTGGYIMPGDPDLPGAVRLPFDLEQAAVEQCASMHLARVSRGDLNAIDLLPAVRETLRAYERFNN